MTPTSTNDATCVVGRFSTVSTHHNSHNHLHRKPGKMAGRRQACVELEIRTGPNATSQPLFLPTTTPHHPSVPAMTKINNGE